MESFAHRIASKDESKHSSCESLASSMDLLQQSVAALTELQATLVEGFRDGSLSTEKARVLNAKTARLRRNLDRLAGMVEVTSHDANHDALTGLPNRTLMVDRLHQAIAQADRNRLQVAVLFIDLNGFKAVNDRHGHAAGDKLLQHVANMLQGALRGSDTACRFGGDEFVVLLPDIADAGGVPALAEKIRDCIANPLSWLGQTLCISASVGVALYPAGTRNPEHLIELADAAMFRAKGLATGLPPPAVRRVRKPLPATAPIPRDVPAKH